MRIAVTGANGFLGGRVVDRLVRDGRDVVAIGRGIARRDCAVIDERFDRCDLGRIGAVDALLHFAAINDTSVRDEAEIRRVNVDAAIAAMRASIAAGCRRIVYASSMHVYGNVPAPMRVASSPTDPVSLYGRSKLLLERLAATVMDRDGVACIGLRLANVYGPGEAHKDKMASQVLQIARQMRTSDPEIFSPGTQVRDFIHVDDAADAAIKAALLADAPHTPVLNCGSGHGTSFNELVALLNSALGLDRVPRYVPEPRGYIRNVVLDIDPARDLLAWRPRPLAEGLAAYLESGDLT